MRILTRNYRINYMDQCITKEELHVYECFDYTHPNENG